MSKSENITQSIFDAISTIVEKRIANLDYDKTIVATITDISEAKNNIYTVTDGSISFKAQGDGNTYQINDTVKVLIINGDFTDEKFIQGKYVVNGDESKPITYVSPLSSIVDITDNLSTDTESTIYGIVATGDNQKTEVLITTFDFRNDDYQNNDIYDTLFLKASFQTDFDQYDMRAGAYGLHLKLIIPDEDGITPKDRLDLYFNSTRDMFGNPYAFKIYTEQEIKYVLSNWPSKVLGAELYLYQNGQFAYYDNNKQIQVPWDALSIDDIVLNNIRVKDIYFGFGSEISKVDDNSLRAYTEDSLSFTKTNEDTEANRKLKVLWYNKSEDNKYIGFSDGIYDTTYDEKQYRQLIAVNERLLNIKKTRTDIPHDENCLDLQADINEIVTLSHEMSTLITVNLYQTLQSFKDYTLGIDWGDDANPFTPLLNPSKGEYLGRYDQSATDSITSYLNEAYTIILTYAKSTSIENLNRTAFNGISATDTDISAFLTRLHSYLGADKKTYGSLSYNLNNSISNLLEAVDTKVQNQQAFESIYNNYQLRITELLNKIEIKRQAIYNLYSANNLNRLALLATTDRNIGEEYGDKRLNAEFITQNDNRYCLYWYRYDQTATTADDFMPVGWVHLPELDNKGLPTTTTVGEDGVTQYYTKKAGINDYAEIDLRVRQNEIFAAVLFYNHNQYTSKDITFTNTENILNKDIVDQAGALSIMHGENSEESYQLYSSTGLLLNAADAIKTRWLKANYDDKTNKDEQLIGSTIYWYVPNSSTMLLVANKDIKTTFNTDRVAEEYNSLTDFNEAYEKGKIYNTQHYKVNGVPKKVNPACIDYLPGGINAVEAIYDNYEAFAAADKNPNVQYLYKIDADDFTYQLMQYNNEWIASSILSKFIDDNISTARTGYDCYWRTIEKDITQVEEVVDEECLTFPYRVSDYYRQTATKNKIICEIIKNDIKYETEMYFSFASFGTSGTNYTLTLTPNLGAPMVPGFDEKGDDDTDGLYIQTVLYDCENKIIPLGDKQAGNHCEYSWIGPTDYKDAVAKQNETGNDIGCTITRTTNTTESYCGILACTINNVIIPDLNNKKINLTSYLPVPYGRINSYYLEGPTTIIYDSLGTNASYYKKPYTLYNNNTKVLNVQWRIRYYYYNGTGWTYYTLNSDNKPLDSNGDPITDTKLLGLDFIPKLINTNELQVGIMYIDTASDNDKIYPVVVAFTTDETDSSKETVLWTQPLLIMQNQYSSPMLNEWDGNLKIDEDANTIMSAMLGAGTRNSDGTFSGILMGDVGKAGDAGAHKIGLYGVHEGAQSFGFKVDGTAFLGKSGGGRIEFDGTNGTITSASYSNNGTGVKIDLDTSPYLSIRGTQQELLHLGDNEYYLQSNNYNTSGTGMKIDLANGLIDSYTFKLTTGNFTLSNEHLTPDSGSNLNTWYSTLPSGGKIIFKSGAANQNFAITNTGYFFAEAGRIANWDIGPNSLTVGKIGEENSFCLYANGSGTGTIYGYAPSSEDNNKWALGIGTNFGVLKDGSFYSSRGKIGSFEITTDSLSGGMSGITLQNNTISCTNDATMNFNGVTISNSGSTTSLNSDTGKKMCLTTAEGTLIELNNEGRDSVVINYHMIATVSISWIQSGDLLLPHLNGYYQLVVENPEMLPYLLKSHKISWKMHMYYSGSAFPSKSQDVEVTIDKNFTTAEHSWYHSSALLIIGEQYAETWMTDTGGSTSLSEVAKVDCSNSASNSTRTISSYSIKEDDTKKRIKIDGSLVPVGSPVGTLGTPDNYWRAAYISGATASAASIGELYDDNSTSDIRYKNNITNFVNEYEVFFNSIKPVRYKYNHGTSNRYHTGFIAQQLVEALQTSGLTTQDFAGIKLYHPGEADERWYLRRDEFVALNTWQIQKLKPRMTEAEERIYKLEQELQELKSKLI